ncbi:hypothetical protein GMOD_00002731 [Pyrenophora seminiperda CCB06]|uniref:C3H1-type domain-containing protein n=1 Tax=Pyrenophora seminiperda CCB06 TaxID=1302712 RepID=A0A3M7M306_9PLEO|nr:hypothetical protein GMOD_00002731 [Pyrenophora seminiperda CCB06]
MCLSAYALRLHEAALPAYAEHIVEDFRQDLLDMFTYAHTKGTFKQGTAARHMVPRLTGNPPWTRDEKDSLVRDFIEHYNDVRQHLDAIDVLYNSNNPINNDFITAMRNRVSGLHNSLAGGAKWRSILPYTPLPMECLTWLTWSIAGRKPYQLLGDLVSYIEDVKNWLTIPTPTMDLHPDVRASVKKALEQELEKDSKDKATKAHANPPPETHIDVEAVAKLQKQVAQQLRQQKEQVKDIERRERDLRVEAARLSLQNEKAKEQEKLSQEAVKRAEAMAEKAQHQIKELEDAATQQRAQEIVRHQREAVAATEREDAYRKQMALNAKEVADLQAALSAAEARVALHQALSTAKPPMNLGSLDGPVISDREAHNSFLQPQNSFETIFGLNGYNQPFLNMTNDHVPEPLAIPSPMEDVRNLPLDPRYRNHSNLYDPTQPIIFGSNQEFKEACPAWKAGKCRYGKKCKRKHEPCKKWMNDICTFGARCNNSHDPFFKEQTGQMNIDSNLPTTQIGQRQLAIPTGPKGMLKNGMSVSHTDKTSTAVNMKLQQIAGALHEPQKPHSQKKLACRNHQKGKCSKSDDECLYAHKPCPHFIKNACKFTAETCRRSHDPAFLNSINAKDTFSKRSGVQSPPQQPISDIQRQLDVLLNSVAPGQSRKATKAETPCVHQQRPGGCTKPGCPFKHNSPKGSPQGSKPGKGRGRGRGRGKGKQYYFNTEQML